MGRNGVGRPVRGRMRSRLLALAFLVAPGAHGAEPLVETIPIALSNVTFTVHTLTGSAVREIIWPDAGHPQEWTNAQQAAQANLTPGSYSGLLNRSHTHTYSTRFGGLNQRYTANYLRADQEMEIDLTPFPPEQGYTRGRLEWPLCYVERTGDINSLFSGHPTHTSRVEVVAGEVSRAVQTLVPPWVPYNTGAYFGGYGARTPTLVIERQLQESPLQDVNPDDCLAMVGAPINVLTGNKWKRQVDVRIPTPGIPLEFVRTYNSQSTEGWSHNYQISLADRTTVFLGETNRWKVLSAGSAQLHFKELAPELYQSPLGTDYGLTHLPGNEFQVNLDAAAFMMFRPDGKVRTISDGAGNALSMTYTNDPLAGVVLQAVDHNRGVGLTFAYRDGRLDRVSTPSTNLYISLSYDAEGRLQQASRVLPDVTYTDGFGYLPCTDGSGYALVSQTNAIGQVGTYGFETNQAGQLTSRAVSTEFGPGGFLATRVDYPTNGLSRTVTVHRNGFDQVYEYLVNPVFHKVEAIVGPNPVDSARARETRFTFDEQGNRTSVITADWDRYQWTHTELRYDEAHRVTRQAFGYMTHSPTQFWDYTWHPDFHTPTSVTDPEGHVTEMDYTNGLVSAIRLMVDTGQYYQTSFAYTPEGQLAAVTNPNGHAVSYTYDAFGYPDLVTPAAGPQLDLAFNVLGQLETVTLPGPGGNRVTRLEPDGLGRVRRATYPNGLSETFVYDGVDNLLTNRDAAGREIRYTYEPMGRLHSVTRPLIEGGVTQAVTTAFDHDQQFNTLRITDPLGREVEAYQLDDLDRAVAITNVEGQVMSVDYGVGDYVDRLVRFDQSEVLYTYDPGGRLHESVFADDVNTLTYYRNDLLQTASNAVSSFSNTYDAVNRLTRTVAQVSGFPTQVSYAYASAGQITQTLTQVSGFTSRVSYAYDAAERVTRIEDTAAGFFDLAYDPHNGRLAAVHYPNGLTRHIGYDAMDRTTNITYALGPALFASIDYGYHEATGMITNRSQHSVLGLHHSSYAYDTLDRLTGETRRDQAGNLLDDVRYSYDLAGNRLSKTRNQIAVSYGYGAGNQLTHWIAVPGPGASLPVDVSGVSSEPVGSDPRFGEHTVNHYPVSYADSNFWLRASTGIGIQELVAAVGDQAGNMGYATNQLTLAVVTNAVYGYDPAGNLTRIDYAPGAGSLAFTWNQQYQLLSVTTNGSLAEAYTYDVFGRRLTTTRGSATVVHMYDGIHCIADTDANGVPLRTYTYGPGIDHPLALTVHQSTETNTYYYITDHLGSVFALTDATGAQVESYDYDAWGRTTVFDAVGTPLTESAYGNPLTFQGREHSWATGLTYFRARWYDPITARWLSKDPIGISGGLNQYAAFANNPVMYLDPLGAKVYVVSRKLNSKYGSVGAHTWLVIRPDNPADFGNQRRWTLGGYNDTKTGRLASRRDDSVDVGWSEPIKGWWKVPRPVGVSDTEFIRSILEAFERYTDQSRAYEAFPDTSDNEGNCNTITTGALMGAGVPRSWIENLNPAGFNPGLGDPLPEMLRPERSP